MTDARFEDADETPLRLVAQAPDDVPVISALVQDAVFAVTDMTWDRRGRRFALLLNRFRWEDKARADRGKRGYERVRSLLIIGDALNVATNGVNRSDPDLVLSVLSVTFQPGEDGAGDVIVTLAGDGAVRVSVECLDLTLRDVTRPYLAPSGKAPRHGE